MEFHLTKKMNQDKANNNMMYKKTRRFQSSLNRVSRSLGEKRKKQLKSLAKNYKIPGFPLKKFTYKG